MSAQQEQPPPNTQPDAPDQRAPSAIDRIKPQLITSSVGDPAPSSKASGGGGGARGSSPQRRGSKDFLAPAGINIERRRGSAATPNYRIEKNQIIVEGKDGSPEQRLEILEIHEKPGKFKRALPALPLPLAIFFCILNFVLPGFGTLFGGIYARFSSTDTEQVTVRSQTGAEMAPSSNTAAGKTTAPNAAPAGAGEDPLEDPTPPLSKREKFSLNIGAAVLQLVGTPIFLVGWIWSINWGIVMVSLAMHKRMALREAAQESGGNANIGAEGKT